MARRIWLIGRDCEGASAIEYGLLATLICVAAILAIEGVGGSLSDMLGVVTETISGVVAGVSQR